MSDKQQGSSEAALGWGILVVIFGGLFYLVWYFFSAQIMSGVRWLRYGEMWLTSHFVSKNYTISWKGDEVPLAQIMDLARTMPADKIDGQFMSLISTGALMPIKFIVIALIFGVGLWALFKGPGTQHRVKYSLDTLIHRMAKIFPIISPMIEFDPGKQPPRAPGAPVPAELPPFAEALGPEEWVAYNSIPAPDGKVDSAEAFKAFTKQLGPRWKGAQNLPSYKQILLAAFCLKAARKRNDSDEMLGRLARCWTHKDGLKLSKDAKLLKEARAILKNRDMAAKTLAKANQHAWQTTAMMRALLTAREEGGVLAPAQFVWLRAYDRALWYPLNNMGRQSHHMEAIGAMAHFKAEKMAQRPIPIPKVQDAAGSIVNYMQGGTARPIPQLDYSGSKKRAIKKLKTA